MSTAPKCLPPALSLQRHQTHICNCHMIFQYKYQILHLISLASALTLPVVPTDSKSVQLFKQRLQGYFALPLNHSCSLISHQYVLKVLYLVV